MFSHFIHRISTNSKNNVCTCMYTDTDCTREKQPKCFETFYIIYLCPQIMFYSSLPILQQKNYRYPFYHLKLTYRAGILFTTRRHIFALKIWDKQNSNETKEKKYRQAKETTNWIQHRQLKIEQHAAETKHKQVQSAVREKQHHSLT